MPMTFWRRWKIDGMIACLLVIAAVPARAREEEATLHFISINRMKLTPIGKGSLEFGQIVKGQYAFAAHPIGKLDHFWCQKAKMQLGLIVQHDNGFGLDISCEGSLYFPYSLPGDGSGFGFEYLGPRFRLLPNHSEGSYTIGDREKPLLYVGVGFFPYKYNPDGTNFGDYLFRVNSYPQYFPTHFDSPYQHLLGLRLSTCVVPSLKLDAMLISEVYLWPLRDFSPAMVANYSFFNFFELGAGIIGHRLFSVDERLTTPPKSEQDMLDSTARFTFAGTRVVARAAFDPKKLLFPGSTLLSKHDLRLYGEICLNGLKNYPIIDTANSLYPGYDNLSKRTLILVGVNIPTFRFFDVLSVEVEWWNNDFANSYWGAYPSGGGYKQNPNPWKYGARGLHDDSYGGPWHWSVYAKRTILENFHVILQFSRDHTILETTLTTGTNGDPQEAMDGRGNWMWMAKIEYGIK